MSLTITLNCSLTRFSLSTPVSVTVQRRSRRTGNIKNLTDLLDGAVEINSYENDINESSGAEILVFEGVSDAVNELNFIFYY